MTVQIFPVANNIVKIPTNQLCIILEQLNYKFSISNDKIKIIENDFDIDFRELNENEITPEIKASIAEAKKASPNDFVNL